MATYQTYQQVGIKEDISNIITNISPTKTPFQTAIGNEKVHNTLFQWQEDSLRSAASNAAVEGADATAITAVPTVMRNNSTQILTETVIVSGTADAVQTYGRARESAYQMAKTAAALKRDLEFAFVGSQQTQVVGNSTTARQMAGYQAQIASGQTYYTGAGPAPLNESTFLTALQGSYVAGAEPSIIMVSPTNSLIVAGFAKASGRLRQITDNQSKNTTVVNAVEFYMSPFGSVKIALNRFSHAGDTLVFDPSMWVKATLRPWFRETLARTGDALKIQMLGEFSLKHKNYMASALIVEGTTGL